MSRKNKRPQHRGIPMGRMERPIDPRPIVHQPTPREVDEHAPIAVCESDAGMINLLESRGYRIRHD